MPNPVGRPLKYRYLLEQLLDDELYTPSAVVDFAETSGELHLPEGMDRQTLRVRIRHTLARFSKSHNFPAAGDGLLCLKGQGMSVAWLGSRWKEAMPPILTSRDQLLDTEAPKTFQEGFLSSELAVHVVPALRL